MKVQEPTTVITANGEVQTCEEAQVFVYDLELFVTVQMLDDTLVVLSSGKLCEEHGCTYEWVSDQKTTVDREWRKNSIVPAGFIEYLSESSETTK